MEQIEDTQKNSGQNPITPMITLNVNKQNTQSEKRRASNWIQEQKPTICCSLNIWTPKEERKRLGKKYTIKTPIKRAMLIPEKEEFWTKTISRDKEGHCIMEESQFSKKT